LDIQSPVQYWAKAIVLRNWPKLQRSLWNICASNLTGYVQLNPKEKDLMGYNWSSKIWAKPI
jgi:hypothetical protein